MKKFEVLDYSSTIEINGGSNPYCPGHYDNHYGVGYYVGNIIGSSIKNAGTLIKAIKNCIW